MLYFILLNIVGRLVENKIRHVLLCRNKIGNIILIILNLMGGPYPGRTLGRFGVQPANVGPGRGLGLRPGRVLGWSFYPLHILRFFTHTLI